MSFERIDDVKLRDWALHQPCLHSCKFCDWTWVGPVAEGREQHAHHRSEAHGMPVEHRRFQKRFNPWKNDLTLEANVAGARVQGAATWAGDETA